MEVCLGWDCSHGFDCLPGTRLIKEEAGSVAWAQKSRNGVYPYIDDHGSIYTRIVMKIS